MELNIENQINLICLNILINKILLFLSTILGKLLTSELELIKSVKTTLLEVINKIKSKVNILVHLEKKVEEENMQKELNLLQRYLKANKMI
jgi:hypothetical protein